nr:unnamed protein product [Callosobruchus analis]
MPRTCCVSGCKANYNSTPNAGCSLISSFGFPNDETLKINDSKLFLATTGFPPNTRLCAPCTF